MAAAYAVFANNGRTVHPAFLLKIEDSRGNVLYKAPAAQQGKQVIEEETAPAYDTYHAQCCKPGNRGFIEINNRPVVRHCRKNRYHHQ
jgi:penicillin-binding protein 2D